VRTDGNYDARHLNEKLNYLRPHVTEGQRAAGALSRVDEAVHQDTAVVRLNSTAAAASSSFGASASSSTASRPPHGWTPESVHGHRSGRRGHR
jgi:hypothetical protein